jgi:hypothetical protein
MLFPVCCTLNDRPVHAPPCRAKMQRPALNQTRFGLPDEAQGGHFLGKGFGVNSEISNQPVIRPVIRLGRPGPVRSLVVARWPEPYGPICSERRT